MSNEADNDPATAASRVIDTGSWETDDLAMEWLERRLYYFVGYGINGTQRDLIRECWPGPGGREAAVRDGGEEWRELPSVMDDHGATGCMSAFSEGQECTAPEGIATAIREGK